MARLHVMERSHAQAVMDDLHDALGRRLAVSSLAPCPVEFTAALVNLCSTQSCGKCTPCRVGLSALSDLLADVLEGRADESTLNLIERTARTIYLSSDCAIGDDELPDLSGQRVCVIGGGNVAMDVARSAVRCGAEKVSIVYRRRICDMTAQDAEIAGAQAEGCEVLELTAPLAIETDEDGRVSGLRVQPQIIGEPRRGRPAPRAAATPERVIPCERVFVAIGQDIDSKPFEEMGIACKWGCVVTDSDGAVPNFDGLFSGGDCQTGPATVVRAINAGRVASANIDRYLGFDHKIKLEVELPTVRFKGKHECGRCELGERESGERIHDWNLVEQGLTEQEARQEASRCLRCDHFGFGAFRGGRNLEW